MSLEAYGTIVKGNRISEFLKTDLGTLASESADERDYLNRAYWLIRKILKDQESYLENWLIDKRFDEDSLCELIDYIRTVQGIPGNKKVYLDKKREIDTVEAKATTFSTGRNSRISQRSSDSLCSPLNRRRWSVKSSCQKFYKNIDIVSFFTFISKG